MIRIIIIRSRLIRSRLIRSRLIRSRPIINRVKIRIIIRLIIRRMEPISNKIIQINQSTISSNGIYIILIAHKTIKFNAISLKNVKDDTEPTLSMISPIKIINQYISHFLSAQGIEIDIIIKYMICCKICNLKIPLINLCKRLIQEANRHSSRINIIIPNTGFVSDSIMIQFPEVDIV